MSDEKKEGILLGIELMGEQGEKWLDNPEQAIRFRNDLKGACGFSGWRETYEHTAGFIFAEEPEDCVMDFALEPALDPAREQELARLRTLWNASKSEYEADMREIYESKEKRGEGYEEESDVSDIELTDDETEGGFEIDHGEDEEDEYGTEWTTHMYENVQYLVGPNPHQKGNSDEKVVLEIEDYQPVGVFENGEITFEDHDRVCEHFDRVRESTVPEDPEKAVELITGFIKDNYKGYNVYTYQESDSLPSMMCIAQPPPAEEPAEIVPLRQMWFHFGGVHAVSVDTTKFLPVLGKNMGEVMKEIEKTL